MKLVNIVPKLHFLAVFGSISNLRNLAKSLFLRSLLLLKLRYADGAWSNNDGDVSARSYDNRGVSAWSCNDGDASARSYDNGDASDWCYDDGNTSAQS